MTASSTVGRESRETPGGVPCEDHVYIVKIIQFLEDRFGIRLFITSRDFDTLYRWWEKRIPLAVIEESIVEVVERRRRRQKAVDGFANFSYAVRKNFSHHQQLHVGVGIAATTPEDDAAEIDRFLARFPDELQGLKGDFMEAAAALKRSGRAEMKEIHRKLLERFADDPDLNLRTHLFMQGLAEPLRKPDIERRYRLNFIWHRYRIPDFER